MTLLPTPDADDVLAWTQTHLGDLTRDGVRASGRFRGGQQAADTALASLDATGYARRRNEVLPVSRRGATGLSPYIRHGLLPLRRVWDAAGDAPSADRTKLRDELLWQEYARHLYARVGTRTRTALRADPPGPARPWAEPWPRDMACVDLVLTELEEDGWLVNQTRMWLASQWTVRAGWDWAAGEDEMFAQLLDGSRAANRLGWQWTTGVGSGKPYGFSRWQVRKRAPGVCDGCALQHACPIEQWPDEADTRWLPREPLLAADPDPERTAGPHEPARTGTPEAVWLTAESLGTDDPALVGHPDLPVVFVFDEPLLARLRLAGPRLVFLAETLAELAGEREVELHRGDPVQVLAGRPVAATAAPVPGFRRRADTLDVVVTHPWPWLVRPGNGAVQSFSAWRKGVGRP